jgi:hypothetical protein
MKVREYRKDDDVDRRKISFGRKSRIQVYMCSCWWIFATQHVIIDSNPKTLWDLSVLTSQDFPKLPKNEREVCI